VVVPLDSNTATIQPDSVSFDKMLDASAASRLIGRGSAGGAGTFEEITLGGNMTMTGTVLDSTGGGATALNDLTDVTLTSPATDSILIKTAGDYIDGLIVTNSVTNSAITLAKIQDAAANERLLGSGAAGTGNPYTELTIGSSLSFSGTVLSVAAPSSAGLSGYVMNDSSVIVADHTDRVVNGDARGANAVDLQTNRSGASQVASGATSVVGGGRGNLVSVEHSTIGGGDSNSISGGGSTHVIAGGSANDIAGGGVYNAICGGFVNLITTSGVDAAAIGGGARNSIEQDNATIPGGSRATARRFGEMAYGGGSDADAQRVMNVATVLTSDATQTIMGHTSTNGTWATTTLDAATIPFPSSDTFMLAFEGYVIGMRAEVAGDDAACFKIEGAVQKNAAGTIRFIGNPKVSVVGRDDVNLDCDVVLAGSNAGVNIRVTGLAGEEWTWACEWEGCEMLVPDLT